MSTSDVNPEHEKLWNELVTAWEQARRAHNAFVSAVPDRLSFLLRAIQQNEDIGPLVWLLTSCEPEKLEPFIPFLLSQALHPRTAGFARYILAGLPPATAIPTIREWGRNRLAVMDFIEVGQFLLLCERFGSAFAGEIAAEILKTNSDPDSREAAADYVRIPDK